MSQSFVSVVMPVYNAERYLSKAIESILNQTHSNFEFLIFDDGSRDSSKNIISSYAAMDKRIVPFYYEVNKGYVVHLNAGIALSKGEFIARMDSDDISMPDRLTTQLNFLKANPSISVVGSSTVVIDHEGNELKQSYRNISPAALWWQSFFTNPMVHPSVMFRKSIFQKVGLYDPEKIPSEDYDLWVRIASVGKLANIYKPLLKYREHNLSISVSKTELQKENSIQTLKDHWRLCNRRELTDEIAMFFRSFHRGFEGLPLTQMRNTYFLIIRLYITTFLSKGFVTHIERDAFNKLLYLSLRVRKYSFLFFVEMILILFLIFPVRMVGKFFNL